MRRFCLQRRGWPSRTRPRASLRAPGGARRRRGRGGRSERVRPACQKFVRHAVQADVGRETVAAGRRLLLQLNRQSHVEGASLAEFAHQRNLASQQLRQLLHDGKPEARPAVLAGHGVGLAGNGVPLAEFLEDCRLFVERDADARVFDEELEHRLVDRPCPHADPAPFGRELDGVREQVVQDLLNLDRILQQEGHGRIDLVREIDVPLVREGIEQADLPFDQVGQRALDDLNLHPAALDFGEVEQVVDHHHQRIARRLDVADEPLLFVREVVRVGQDVAETKDAVKGRSQFVAHRRQEVVFELVHLVQPQVHLGQLVDFAVEIGVHGAQFVLHSHQVPQHAVERMAQFLEFIARANVGPQFEISAGDLVADVLEVQDRLHDHVTHDRVGGQNGQRRRSDAGCQEDGIVFGEVFSRRIEGDVDLHDPHQLALFDVGVGLHESAMAFDARLLRDDALEVLVFAVLFFDRPVMLRLPLLRRLLEQDLHRVVILRIARAELPFGAGRIALERFEEAVSVVLDSTDASR